MNPTKTLLCLSVLAAGAFAQTYGITMPNENTFNEGTSYGPLFQNVGRLQQAIGDLHNTKRTFFSLGFRRDAFLPDSAAYVARTLEVEIKMAKTTRATMTQTFATNPTTVPTTVFTKKTVNAPSWVSRPRSQPANADLTFAFDTPYSYDGVDDLLWDLRITATSAPLAAYPIDFATHTGLSYGPYTMQGTGCTSPTGRVTLRSAPVSNSLQNTTSIYWDLAYAPPSSSCAILVGASDPASTIPGLCEVLHVDTLLTLNGATTSGGTFATPTATVPWQSAFAGMRLQAQAIVADATKPGIPLNVSNGLWTRIAYMPQPTIQETTVASYGNANATTGLLTTGQAAVCYFKFTTP